MIELGDAKIPPLDMVASGAVRPHEARIWVRSSHPGEVVVRCTSISDGAETHASACVAAVNTCDNTAVIELDGLRAATKYRYTAWNASIQRPIGTGRFETAPANPSDAPDQMAIAFASCNMPFQDDGTPSQDAREMLCAARAALDRHDPKLLLMIGDQMYTDMPASCSLFEDDYFARVRPRPEVTKLLDCTADEIRSILHSRYRAFWSMPDWQALQATYPTHMMWDDHEIVDNWGSGVEHAQQKWRSLFEGARRAAYDYEMARALPESVATAHDGVFDQQIEYGDIGIYIFDLRSARTGGEDAQICSEAQFGAFESFLADHGAHSVLFIVLTVPMVHIPQQLARLGAKLAPRAEDFSDRWESAGHSRDRDRVLEMLRVHHRRHPRQRLVLLGGDIHVGGLQSIEWRDGSGGMLQMISSALSNRAFPALRHASAASMCLVRSVEPKLGVPADVRLLDVVAGKNPYAELNLGVIELRRRADRRELRCLLYGHRGPAPIVALDSGWI